MARSKENVNGAENSTYGGGWSKISTYSVERYAQCRPAAGFRVKMMESGQDQHEEIETTSPIQLSLSPARKAVSNP